MGLVSLCLSYINEIGKNVDQVFGKGFSPYTEIKNKTSFDALYQWSVNDYIVDIRMQKAKELACTLKKIDQNNITV